jgi:pimeloyl-ACP methyl ester carboxylesterase
MDFHHFLKILLLLVQVLMVTGCAQQAKVPMETVYFNQSGERQNDCLVVFLPGRWNTAASFADEGFVSAVRRTGLHVDMMAAEAHMGYYLEHTLPERLREDVIIPAKNRGYEHIWLIGISLGGLGALWYDGKYPGELEGMVLFAPYLGEPETYMEVFRSGGLAKWNPPPLAEDDYQRKIWLSLKSFEACEKNFARIYLGYGLQDKFAVPDGMFAEVLPKEQVFTVEGGHDWPTWRSLWEEILRESVLAQKPGVVKK